MMPLNQYAGSGSGFGSFLGGTKDFLDFGLTSWAKIEQFNAAKDSNPNAQKQLADVDQQPAPVVHQTTAQPASETMVFGFPQKTVIAGFGLMLVAALLLRGK
jgi:hypothetical protein